MLVHAVIQDCMTWHYLDGRHVARRRRRRWAHAPVIHAASHFYREKRVAWVSISMHACDHFPIIMELRLAALRAPGAQGWFSLSISIGRHTKTQLDVDN